MWSRSQPGVEESQRKNAVVTPEPRELARVWASKEPEPPNRAVLKRGYTVLLFLWLKDLSTV